MKRPRHAWQGDRYRVTALELIAVTSTLASLIGLIGAVCAPGYATATVRGRE